MAQMSALLSDEEEDESAIIGAAAEAPPLSLRLLRDNVVRFRHAVRPLAALVGGVAALYRWDRPATSITFLLVRARGAQAGGGCMSAA